MHACWMWLMPELASIHRGGVLGWAGCGFARITKPLRSDNRAQGLAHGDTPLTTCQFAKEQPESNVETRRSDERGDVRLELYAAEGVQPIPARDWPGD
jgi:hypothetical protein